MKPEAWKICPLLCSLVPEPGLGWRVLVLLCDSSVSALIKKFHRLVLLTCRVGIGVVSVTGWRYVTPGS